MCTVAVLTLYVSSSYYCRQRQEVEVVEIFPDSLYSYCAVYSRYKTRQLTNCSQVVIVVSKLNFSTFRMHFYYSTKTKNMLRTNECFLWYCF